MPGAPLPATARISDAVVFRELEGEGVLLNLDSGVYFGLDSVGTRIWQLIEQHGALVEVLEAIVREFEVERPAAERDLAALVQQLRTHGLVETDG